MTKPNHPILKFATTLVSKSENHKRSAAHLQAAAKHHLEAARQFKAGNHVKENECYLAAQKEISLAIEAQQKNLSSALSK